MNGLAGQRRPGQWLILRLVPAGSHPVAPERWARRTNIGRFELDPTSRRVLTEGSMLAIGGRAFDLLALRAQRAPCGVYALWLAPLLVRLPTRGWRCPTGHSPSCQRYH
jgi:hypothetical protein